MLSLYLFFIFCILLMAKLICIRGCIKNKVLTSLDDNKEYKLRNVSSDLNYEGFVLIRMNFENNWSLLRTLKEGKGQSS